MILDHVDKLELVAEEDYLFDAQMTLARLSQGLFWLYDSVAQLERRVREEAAKDDVRVSIVGGVIQDVPTDWLSCAFQWYAVSVCNYVRLVGWLAKKDTSFINGYVKKVLPKVTTYRHKVAAHFAITAPQNDNKADLRASVMTSIVYAQGFLRAGAISEILTDERGNEIEVSNKTSWSLTKTHDSLLPRYWPDGPLKASQSIKMSAGARKFVIDWKD